SWPRAPRGRPSSGRSWAGPTRPPHRGASRWPRPRPDDRSRSGVTAPAEPTESPHMWLRAGLTSIAFVALVPVAIVLVGAYLPGLPLAGRFGAFVMETVHWLGVLAFVAAVLAIAAVFLGGGGRTRALLVASVVGLLAVGIVFQQ